MCLPIFVPGLSATNFFALLLLFLHCFRTGVPSNFGVQTRHDKHFGITGRDRKTHAALRPTRGGLSHTRGPVVGDLLDNFLDAIVQISLIEINCIKYNVARNSD